MNYRHSPHVSICVVREDGCANRSEKEKQTFYTSAYPHPVLSLLIRMLQAWWTLGGRNFLHYTQSVLEMCTNCVSEPDHCPHLGPLLASYGSHAALAKESNISNGRTIIQYAKDLYTPCSF